MLGYFTLCLWIVPFALFVSLNANDNVLPTVNERTDSLRMLFPPICVISKHSIAIFSLHYFFSFLSNADDNDIVTNYFSSRGRKIGLLSLFDYAKESILPQRNKKGF